MAKRFATIFFIVIAIALFLVVGFVLLLFLAPGFSAFGLRYIAYGTRKFDSGKLVITDEIGSFSGNFILETDEVPVYICYSQGMDYEIRYYENFSGLTRSKIENPSIDISKDANGNAVIKVNEYEKFIFQNVATEKFVKIYIPLSTVSSGSKAYNTNLTLNLGKSNLTFEKDEGGPDGDLRVPTHKNITVKTNGKVSYTAEVRAKKFSYETNSSIFIGEDVLSAINAEDYTLKSGGKIEIARDVTGDVTATTNNRNLKLIGCKNLYAETGHGHISCYNSDAEIEIFGIVKITTKTGNVILGNVNGDGTNTISTGSGNVTIKKIKDGSITTKRGSITVNSVRDMKIETNMGKVVVEEALTKIDVTTKRGKITVGGTGMTVNNPRLFSRLGSISLNSASGTVYIETISSDITFTNTNSSSMEIYSGGKLNAVGLQGVVTIKAEEETYLKFNSISGNANIEVGDKCKKITIYATNDNASETRYIIEGKAVTRYEDDETDDIAAYKMGTPEPLATNKVDGSGPLLDVYGKNAEISVYFKIENTIVD